MVYARVSKTREPKARVGSTPSLGTSREGSPPAKASRFSGMRAGTPSPGTKCAIIANMNPINVVAQLYIAAVKGDPEAILLLKIHEAEQLAEIKNLELELQITTIQNITNIGTQIIAGQVEGMARRK